MGDQKDRSKKANEQPIKAETFEEEEGEEEEEEQQEIGTIKQTNNKISKTQNWKTSFKIPIITITISRRLFLRMGIVLGKVVYQHMP